MHEINIPETEYWDESREMFITCKATRIKMEHSLVAISKWESKWHKSFLSTKDKTEEEIAYYIRCMILTPDVDPLAVMYIENSVEILDGIQQYMNDSMTATPKLNNENKSRSREIVTSELIYYWMIETGIPVEFQYWHISRLLTLIEVVNFKRTPPKKMSRKELARRNSEINKARRAKYHTKG